MIAWALWTLLLGGVVLMLLSPLESARWFAERGRTQLRDAPEADPEDTTDVVPGAPRTFVVYLSGVGTVIGDQQSSREMAWLEALGAELPEATVIGDVFPYAANSRDLIQRSTVRMWRWLERGRRTKKIRYLHFLINVRNVLHVLVSADPRYGPAHSLGLSETIMESLLRRGYVPGRGDRVVLVGYSGGGQMAVGAAWFLTAAAIPVWVVSIAGIFGDDPGLDRVRHLWQLTGSRDRMHLLGPVAFPGRWPTAPLSPWGRAVREGRVTKTRIGSMAHDGARAYFGRRYTEQDGRPYAQVTLDAVAGIVREISREPADTDR